MADGEIAVSVQAEGTEDAVGEMGGGPEVGGGGDAPDGGGGGGGGGRFGKLLSRIATLLVFLGPILDVLGAVANVITAFVAPMAVMLLRILQPVMVLLLKILPFWLSFMSFVNDLIPQIYSRIGEVLNPLMFLGAILSVAQRLRGLMGDLKSRLGAARDRIGDVVAGIMGLPGRIRTFIEQLPGQIASELGSLGPDLSSVGGPIGALRERFQQATGGDSGGGVGRQAVNLVISGGLSPFIEQIEQNGSVDFP